jgi:hypothetical protein
MGHYPYYAVVLNPFYLSNYLRKGLYAKSPQLALSYLYDKLKELDQYNMSTKRGREFDNDWDKEMN